MSAVESIVAHRRAPAPTAAERMARLAEETADLAREHIREFAAALREARRLADEIAEGGEAYPVGIREIARRLSPEMAGGALGITSITGRS